jgi:hypothetical protein
MTYARKNTDYFVDFQIIIGAKNQAKYIRKDTHTILAVHILSAHFSHYLLNSYPLSLSDKIGPCYWIAR